MRSGMVEQIKREITILKQVGAACVLLPGNHGPQAGGGVSSGAC